MEREIFASSRRKSRARHSRQAALRPAGDRAPCSTSCTMRRIPLLLYEIPSAACAYGLLFCPFLPHSLLLRSCLASLLFGAIRRPSSHTCQHREEPSGNRNIPGIIVSLAHAYHFSLSANRLASMLKKGCFLSSVVLLSKKYLMPEIPSEV